MKALGVDSPPAGVWHCEIKFDGYRALAVLDGKDIELWSRNHKPLSADYPEVVTALQRLKCQRAILDGEIVALDGSGKSRFQLLQSRDLAAKRPPIVFYIFDLLHLNGRSLLASPLEVRRAELEKFLRAPAGPLQLSPVFFVEPAVLLKEAHKQGLEGIIAKRPGSLYEVGRRSGAWLKCKNVNEQEFVIGGFTPPRQSRTYFGAILVGYYDRGKLRYAGKVGTGFDQARLASLHALFRQRRSEHCPFDDLPRLKKPRFGQGMTRSEMAKVTWLEPDLVAQIKFGEWTDDGLLRQPVFLGLRSDKSASSVRREAGAITGRKKPVTRRISRSS